MRRAPSIATSDPNGGLLRRLRSVRFALAAGSIAAAAASRADTRPPIDIPALHEAQAQDAAIAAIDRQIRSGEWRAARDAASGLLESSKSVWHGALQRALVRLAFVEATLGEDAEARWHWQALQAMGGASLATPFLESFGASGKKLDAAPARIWDEVPAGVEPPGSPGLDPVRRIGGEVPRGNAGCTAARGPLWARIQAVIDERGSLTRPAISGPSVCFSFEVLKTARRWTFEPARRKGVPVAAIYSETIPPPARRPFRELAGNVAETGEALPLLEAGEFSAAERELDRRWSAALDAGAPSRAATVTLMALRALAFAAREDPADQSRAGCLWEAAQGEEPKFFELDLAPFGIAGRRLEPHRYGEVRSLPMEEIGERIERPRVLPETRRRPRERFPPGAYGASRVFIEAVIDPRGNVREPLLFGGREGMRGLDLDALDSVCSWRFAPATVAGKPVPLLYVLSLSVGKAGPPG